eukprot:1157018-Pelagomonas_calceolata.AAC.2
MDIFCVAGTVQQAEQPNYLAEGKKKKSIHRPQAACIKERSHYWKARGLTRRPSKPTLDTASLGESQRKIKWGSGGLLAMLLDARTLLLLSSAAARPAPPPRSPHENKERAPFASAKLPLPSVGSDERIRVRAEFQFNKVDVPVRGGILEGSRWACLPGIGCTKRASGHQEAVQPNYLAEGEIPQQTLHYLASGLIVIA